MLKPQDIIIALKLCVLKENNWKYNSLAAELHISPSEAHSGVKRLKKCSLLAELSMSIDSKGEKAILPDKQNIVEFLTSGIRYVFPTEMTAPLKGIPTAEGVSHLFPDMQNPEKLTPVWGFETADYYGVGIKPLYKTLPRAALDDFPLYELAAITDALRSDSVKLRDTAAEKLKIMI